MCIISLLLLQRLNNAVSENTRQLEQFELEKNAVMLLDTMVKNHNEENPALGAAFYNEEKHRVEENKIDIDYLKQANPIVTKSIFVNSIELQFFDGTSEAVIYSGIGTNCLGIERPVIAREKKALLKGVVCVE